MTALDLLSEVRRLGGRLTPTPPDRLRVSLPESDQPRLLPLIRERKYDLLMLLAKPDDPCFAGHAPAYWQDCAGQWHCMTCEPNAAWRYLRGVTEAVLGNRPISLQAPTSDLGAPGSWVRTPAGAAAEVVLYRADGAEVLTRTLTGERLAWYAPEQLSWEIDWPWGRP